jgi:chorismate dehydratase
VKLRIGKIPYLNLFPIFHVLEGERDTRSYEFVEGYPSVLNGMLRRAEVDVSPSSSIEYLRDTEGYEFIEDHSVSSFGPIGSILLFSRVPIDALGGREICATHQSETSTALLEVILRKFLKLHFTIKITRMSLDRALRDHPACLLIGDDALAEGEKQKGGPLHVYDLGTLWHEHTGLPFVFAMWIVRRGLGEKKKAMLRQLRKDLDYAKCRAVESFREIAGAPDLKKVMPRQELLDYWRLISYDLGGKHLEGLELFGRYLRELGLVA